VDECKEETRMSTKSSLKFEHNEATGQMAHLYREVFDEGQEYVYLELQGFPFESSSSVDLSGKGITRVAVRLPDALARKLGLLGEQNPEGHPGSAGQKP
jgi:hypothetical protein